MRTFAYFTATLLASVLVVSNAFADEQVRTETVRFQDLNVNTPAGVAVLYRRIQMAAKHVCSQPAEWPENVRAAAACAGDAEAKAIEKLNLPLLTDHYRMKTARHSERLAANR
jgi:UrcA family protein